MSQALHIFLKDTRQFRLPILLLVAWTVLFAFLSAGSWMEFGEYRAVRETVTYMASWLAAYALPLGWAYLIAQVIHAEALPGDRQFWLTRPYSRASLFGAKALFVFSWVLLPMAVAQGAIASAQGLPLRIYLPGLLWEQVLMIAVVVVPIGALAALTSSLAQFAMAALAVPILYFASEAVQRWASFEWIRTSAGIMGLAFAAASVLFVQFRWRRTRSARLVALTSILIVLAALPLLSWDALFAFQSRITGSSSGLVNGELITQPVQSPPKTRVSEPVVRLMYRLSGPPAGSRIRCEAYTFTIEGPGARIWRIDPYLVSSYYALADISDGCMAHIRLPRAFRDAIAGQPVNIRATLYVTVFGKEESNVVPVGQPAVPVRNAGVCEGTPFELLVAGKKRDMVRLDCRSAFREPPVGLVSVNKDTGGSNRLFGGREFSYSPFPADLRFQPVEYGALNVAAADTLTIVTAEPVAHIRVTVDTIGVVLSDFEI